MANYGRDTPLQLVHFSSLCKGSLTQSAEREAVVFDIWEVKGGTIPLCFGNCDQKKTLTTFFLFCHIFSPSQPSRHGQSITCGSPGRFGKLYLDQDRLGLCAQSLSHFLEHPHLCEAADQPGHYRQVWVLSLQPTTQVGSTDLHWWHQNKWWHIQDYLIPKNISILRNPDQPRCNLEANFTEKQALCFFTIFL